MKRKKYRRPISKIWKRNEKEREKEKEKEKKRGKEKERETEKNCPLCKRPNRWENEKNKIGKRNFLNGLYVCVKTKFCFSIFLTLFPERKRNWAKLLGSGEKIIGPESWVSTRFNRPNTGFNRKSKFQYYYSSNENDFLVSFWPLVDFLWCPCYNFHSKK